MGDLMRDHVGDREGEQRAHGGGHDDRGSGGIAHHEDGNDTSARQGSRDDGIEVVLLIRTVLRLG